MLRGQRGLSLVEVLIAIAILGVVVVGFLSAVVSAYGAAIVADRHARAESLTRTVFEYMRSRPYSSDFNDTDVSCPDNWSHDGEYLYPYSSSENYKVQVTSLLCTDNTGSIAKEITVAVLYRDAVVNTTKTQRSDHNKNF